MIAVVAGIIVRDGKIMIAQRPEGKHLAGKWEFPGGKIEKGESPEAALERELREELAVETKTGRIYQAITYSYPEKDVLLLFYFTRIVSGEIAPIEEAQVAWVGTEELAGYDFAPVDRLLVERLKRDDPHILLTIQA